MAGRLPLVIDTDSNEPLGNHIHGWMSDAELVWLRKTAATMQSVVEIGCWKGRSTFALCSSGCPRVIAVDHFRGSVEHQADEMKGLDLRAEFDKNTAGFTNLEVLAMPSAQAAIQVGMVDMVFIDGSHDLESVTQDLTLWVPRASRIVCGHDSWWATVTEAVMHYFKQVPNRVVDSIWIFDKIDQVQEVPPGPASVVDELVNEAAAAENVQRTLEQRISALERTIEALIGFMTVSERSPVGPQEGRRLFDILKS